MASVASDTASADAQSFPQHLNMPTCNNRSQTKKRSKRKHESLSSSLCATLVEHQLGTSIVLSSETLRAKLTYPRPVHQRTHAPRLDTRLLPKPPLFDNSILYPVLLRRPNRPLQSRMARSEVRLALHHSLHRPSRSRHGLCPRPNGQKVRHPQEKGYHPLRRASMASLVLCHILVPRNSAYPHNPSCRVLRKLTYEPVSRLRIAILQQPACNVVWFPDTLHDWSVQALLSGSIRFLVAANHGYQHRGAQKGPLANVHSSHYYMPAPDRQLRLLSDQGRQCHLVPDGCS